MTNTLLSEFQTNIIGKSKNNIKYSEAIVIVKSPWYTKAKVKVPTDFLPSAQVVINKQNSFLRTENSLKFWKTTLRWENIQQDKVSKEHNLASK